MKSPREQIVTVDIMMTSCCLRAPKKHEAWLAWMSSLQAAKTSSAIRFVLLVAVIFAGSPLATKSHYTTLTLRLTHTPASRKMPNRQEPDEDSSQSEFFVSSARIYGVTFVRHGNALHRAREHPVNCCDTQKYSDTPAVHVASC
jgi:hypothetical protein